MPTAKMRMFLDNAPASEEQLAVFGAVRVDQGIGVATEAEIDVPVVAQRFQLEATPESSHVTLVVHDDSVLLNRDEAVASFEDQSASDIAEQLFSDAGMEPRVDSVPAAGSAFTRYHVLRGTPMQMLRRLARDNGMFVYVEPGDAAGASVGVFQRPQAADEQLPDLVLIGAERNIGSFAAA